MRTWTVGDIRVTKVVEYELAVPFAGLLVGAPPDPVAEHPWLAPHYVTPDGAARTSIHGLVVDTGTSRVLVDTCVGDTRDLGAPAVSGGFFGALADAGYAATDIDTVVCTHLHFDHVGCNTRVVDGRRVPAFPRARYLFARREWEHWNETGGDLVDLADSVRPVLEAGLADLVETDHAVCDGVRLAPTPGHTPGHVSVHLRSRDRHAVITGDIAHHPLQLALPHVASPADSDPDAAAETRRRFRAERLADGALVIGTHFPGPTAGRLIQRGPVPEFVPEPTA